jgi:hypothetical protein
MGDAHGLNSFAAGDACRLPNFLKKEIVHQAHRLPDHRHRFDFSSSPLAA